MQFVEKVRDFDNLFIIFFKYSENFIIEIFPWNIIVLCCKFGDCCYKRDIID